MLKRNPLHDIPRHLFLPPVVKPRRSRAAVPGQVLHILKRHALGKQIGDRRYAEMSAVTAAPAAPQLSTAA